MKKALFSATLLLTSVIASTADAAQFRVRMTDICVIEMETVVEAATAEEAEDLANDMANIPVVSTECDGDETTVTKITTAKAQVQ